MQSPELSSAIPERPVMPEPVVLESIVPEQLAVSESAVTQHSQFQQARLVPSTTLAAQTGVNQTLHQGPLRLLRLWKSPSFPNILSTRVSYLPDWSDLWHAEKSVVHKLPTLIGRYEGRAVACHRAHPFQWLGGSLCREWGFCRGWAVVLRVSCGRVRTKVRGSVAHQGGLPVWPFAPNGPQDPACIYSGVNPVSRHPSLLGGRT